jgi:hypothetical protein
MNYKDAFHKTVHSFPGGVEALAPRLGYTAGLLRNKANPNSQTNVLTMDDASRVMEISSDYATLHALAEAHGFVLTKIDEQPATDMGVLESATSVWQQMGQLGTEVHKALSDGRVDKHEVKDIEAAIFATVRPMMSLLSRLNGMAE